MSWSKLEFIKQAYEELGYAAFDGYDLPSGQLETARRRLDAMMATWNAEGVRLGYSIPSTPDAGDIDTLSGVPDSANEAIILNLAIRLAPSIGKQVSPDTKMNAKRAYDTLLALAAMPTEMQFPVTTPLGAGNKPWRGIDRAYVDPPKDPLETGPDGELTFE